MSAPVDAIHDARVIVERLGFLVHLERTRRGLSLRAVASQVGVHHSVVWSLEQDSRNVSAATVCRFLDWLE